MGGEEVGGLKHTRNDTLAVRNCEDKELFTVQDLKVDDGMNTRYEIKSAANKQGFIERTEEGLGTIENMNSKSKYNIQFPEMTTLFFCFFFLFFFVFFCLFFF